MAEATKKTATVAKKTTKSTKAVATSPKKTTRAKTEKVEVSTHELQHMIATNAYYRAERRGFSHGNHMQDWIEAEAEISAKVKLKK
jgi:uncharacterized membrane-anchored protein